MSNTLTKSSDRGVSLPERAGRNSVVFTPRFDIWESDEAFVLYGDLPGVSAEDLDIQFENGQLSIHGRTPLRHAEVELTYGEYGIGDYYRTFSVGQAIDSENIAAEMKDGVLTLTLPKSEAVRPRRVEVKQV